MIWPYDVGTSPFSRWGNWGKERLTNLLKVTQLAQWWSQAVWLQSPHPKNVDKRRILFFQYWLTLGTVSSGFRLKRIVLAKPPSRSPTAVADTHARLSHLRTYLSALKPWVNDPQAVFKIIRNKWKIVLLYYQQHISKTCVLKCAFNF